MKKTRVGIFGGTFNPPHIGHVEAAKAFVEQMQLDELIIMPAFIPPHKDCDMTVTSLERFEMCKIAFKDVSKAVVSDLEISRGGKSFTYLTLQELTREDRELCFLCGTDMILTMDMWRNPDIIFSLAEICYIRREKDLETTDLIEQKCAKYRETYGASVHSIVADVIEISSSDVRGSSSIAKEYLSKDVLEYINKKGFYQ